MADLFVDPSPAEMVATEGLVGRRVNIWWDGDQVYYPGKIMGYEKATGKHKVKYDNDSKGSICPELLSKQPWKVWNGDDKEFDVYNQAQLKAARKKQAKLKLGNDDEDDASDEESTEQKQMAASPPQTYSGMAVKAVAALDDRQGSSLLAIRKYIQANFPPPSKLSTNAFNSLTLKGCMKAVARRELDNIRGLTFKLSKKERERQRLLQEQERERQRAIEERKARKAGKEKEGF